MTSRFLKLKRFQSKSQKSRKHCNWSMKKPAILRIT